MKRTDYDARPTAVIEGWDDHAWEGYGDLGRALRERIEARGAVRTVVAVECYPGVMQDEVLPAIEHQIRPGLVVESAEANLPPAVVQRMLERNLTDDRVRGVLSCHVMEEFFDPGKLGALRARVEAVTAGVVLVYGTGATLVAEPDLLVYGDLARWEIQLRYRRGDLANWCADNAGEDFLRMYKRGFFVDWRVADRHKATCYERIDFFLDTNLQGTPRMISGEALRAGLAEMAGRPFRLVPYFDPGPWGGQWMKEVCGLDPASPNYAWSFDGVPEENSLLLEFGPVQVEVPAINLVLFQARALLGERVYGRFGKEFPIRFDFLDTMDGGNLSLQVHPTTEYIQQHFGMHYTQDESYYMLDAGEDAVVYLGLKEGVDRDAMLADLERAQTGKMSFDADTYINKVPASRHDHFLIPAGTVHCSGRNGMVLEISATPYIFTFKLWDWDRLGLDGKPRPIHLDHGREVINWEWTADTVAQTHVNVVERVGEGPGWVEERTGLHPREFIETRRHWFTDVVPHDTDGGVNVLNLVEGREVIVESPSGAFRPFVVHYAETFIVPASVGAYTLRPHGPAEGSRCATIKAYVR